MSSLVSTGSTGTASTSGSSAGPGGGPVQYAGSSWMGAEGKPGPAGGKSSQKRWLYGSHPFMLLGSRRSEVLLEFEFCWL